MVVVLVLVAGACSRGSSQQSSTLSPETLVVSTTGVAASPTVPPSVPESGGLVRVPDVRDLVLVDALAVMSDAGLAGWVHETDSADSDTVVRTQEPQAGEEVPAGSVVRFRTLTYGERGCETRVVPAGDAASPDSADLSVRVGSVIFDGLSVSPSIAENAFSPDAGGRRAAIKIPLSLDSTAEHVWIALPNETPGSGAALLYDRSTFLSPARYLVSDGHQAVRFEACGGGTGFYNGGFVVDGPRCVDLWTYEDNLKNNPTTKTVGFGIDC